MIGLNKEQQEAVNYIDGTLLLLAGAGSGKTRVITARIAHMISCGISPHNILALTFTNKAAKEMRERVNQIVPEGDAVWVSTFHSSCVRILRREIHHIGYSKSFTIYDSDDSERLVKDCIKELNLNDKLYPSRSALSFISSLKNELISPNEYIPMNFFETNMSNVYALYQKKLASNSALDFDDIIYLTVRLFMVHPDVCGAYQNRFKYICIDEYQDTNTAQYRLVKLLADKYKNLCVVGDDDQSIYGWRGANIRNILDFEKDFPGTKVIRLEQNYRSKKTILNAANAVIANNVNRKEKKLWTENEVGEEISIIKSHSETEEAQTIGNIIKDGIKNGRAYRDFAVLYRNNAQSRAIEEQLVMSGIPYRLFGGVRFYERREIKDILAYLRLINNPRDDLALLRIINVPKRGIGDATLKVFRDYAASLEISLFEALKDVDDLITGAKRAKIKGFYDMVNDLRSYAEGANVDDLINRLLSDTGICDDILAEADSSKNITKAEALARIDNINEFLAKASQYTQSYISVENQTQLSDFLQEVSLVADVDNYEEDEDTAVLMTIHSSKGLEFPVVFLPGFEEGIFPSYRAASSSDDKDIEEERRLCYVAITRARDKLYISTADCRHQYGNVNYNSPSRFLSEIPLELLARFGQAKPVRSNKTEKPDKPNEVKKNTQKVVSFPTPSKELTYAVGDRVKQPKYGEGTVLEIRPAGADFEVTVEFDRFGKKKFMGLLSKMVKVY